MPFHQFPRKHFSSDSMCYFTQWYTPAVFLISLKLLDFINYATSEKFPYAGATSHGDIDLLTYFFCCLPSTFGFCELCPIYRTPYSEIKTALTHKQANLCQTFTRSFQSVHEQAIEQQAYYLRLFRYCRLVKIWIETL